MPRLSYLQQFKSIDLAVREEGDGLPFVWCHGLLGSMNAEDQAEILDFNEIQRQALLIRYDARGHGNSNGSYVPDDYRWSHLALDMLSVAEDIAEARKFQKFVLGGMSMGCSTALEAALKRPAKVLGLVLVLPPTAWSTRKKQQRLYRRMAWASSLFGVLPYRILDKIPLNPVEDNKRRLALCTLKGIAQANPLHVEAILKGAALSDLPDTNELRKITAPALIISWLGDDTHPVSTAERLAEALPNTRSLIVTEASHAGTWTNAIQTFLSDINEH